ncbi:hypothetical protein [Streptomyces aquilus]|uniref:hypothetical protein n=1 Tax=Streptomyces aquilus TaxID=2548456 RepID=UPI0036C38F32
MPRTRTSVTAPAGVRATATSSGSDVVRGNPARSWSRHGTRSPLNGTFHAVRTAKALASTISASSPTTMGIFSMGPRVQCRPVGRLVPRQHPVRLHRQPRPSARKASSGQTPAAENTVPPPEAPAQRVVSPLTA